MELLVVVTFICVWVWGGNISTDSVRWEEELTDFEVSESKHTDSGRGKWEFAGFEVSEGELTDYEKGKEGT